MADKDSSSKAHQTVEAVSSKMSTQTQETTNQDDSFNRLPQAKVRIPDCGIQPLLDSFSDVGMFKGYKFSGELVENGILISLETNLGIYPNIRPYPIDIFIPLTPDQMPKVKPDEEIKVTSEVIKTEAPKQQLTESRVDRTEDIQMASDGDIGGTSGLSGGLGDSDGQGQSESTVSTNDLQPSIREDVVDAQSVVA